MIGTWVDAAEKFSNGAAAKLGGRQNAGPGIETGHNPHLQALRPRIRGVYSSLRQLSV
jgi:hypothetical protein